MEAKVKFRRPGVNVGDTVSFRKEHVGKYADEYSITSEDKFLVTFRQATGFNNGDNGYVLHLKCSNRDLGRTPLAKPGHLQVLGKVEGLLPRPKGATS